MKSRRNKNVPLFRTPPKRGRKKRSFPFTGLNEYLSSLNNELYAVLAAREQLERELEEKCLELKSLVGELNIAEEQERRRIAMELHDNVVQNIALGQLKLNMRSRKASPSEKDLLLWLDGLLEDAITQIRGICFDLSPPLLYELGLTEAISSLGERLALDHRFRFQLRGKVDPVLPDDMKVLLYQTVRELLVNAIKHGRASRIAVSLQHKKGEARISVIDNGGGFSNDRKGYGLSNIWQRVNYLKGTVKIDSNPGRTNVEVVVPVSEVVFFPAVAPAGESIDDELSKVTKFRVSAACRDEEAEEDQA